MSRREPAGAFGVAFFHTNSAVMRAEALLARDGIAVRLVPTPRELSSDCGLAVRFGWTERDRVESVLRAGRVEVAGLHPLDD